MNKPVSGEDLTNVPTAVEHVVRWFDVEEETYASQEKFGHDRNLDYLRREGAEPGAVWESQLNNYWSRAMVLDRELRRAGEDTIAARQYFAKHTNAARAITSTIMTVLNGGDYKQGKNQARTALFEYGDELTKRGLPFVDPTDFSAQGFHGDTLMPNFLKIRGSLRGHAPFDVSWEQAISQVNEAERFTQALGPLKSYLFDSFGVTVAYVVAEGPLPRPGVPSGEIHEWVR